MDWRRSSKVRISIDNDDNVTEKKYIHFRSGQMAVWVGGDKEAYTKVRPVLDASYSSVMYTGGLGTAMIPKVNMYFITR